MPTVYPSLEGGRDIRPFAKRDTITDTSKAGALGALFGLNVVLVKNSLSASRTVAGGLRNHMGTVAVYALVGSAYQFAEAVSANLREEESSWNAFYGGAAAGAIVGAALPLRSSIAKSVGGALILGSVTAAFDWGFDRGKQSSIKGSILAATELTEEQPKQGFWELVHRRPLSQTVEELGDLAKQFVRD